MRRTLALILLAGCSGDGGTDPTTLTVLSVSPASDAVDVALDTPITLELSAPPPADFTVALTASTGEPIEHALAIAGTTVTLTPAHPLWLATGYDVAAADFTSKFQTREGAWKRVPIATQMMAAAAPLGNGAAPSLAALPDGTVFAGWEGGTSVFDQKFTPGAGWLATPGKLDVTGDPGFVEVYAATATRAVAVYDRYITRSNIEARTYDGTRWSAPVTVGPYQVGTVRYDQYVGSGAASEQSYALTFHRGNFDTDQFDVYGAIHDGSAWSAPFLVEDLPGEASSSRIIADGRGGYVIVWIQRSADRLSTAVWMRTLSSSGALGAPQKLDDGEGNTHGLVVSRGGDTVWIAWAHERDGSTVKNRVVTQPFTASGLGAANPRDVDGYFGDAWLQIDASTRGALLVYAIYGGVFASMQANGTWSPFHEVEKIPMIVGSEVGRPALALDDRNNATIVFTRVPPSGRRTTVVARARNGDWSPAAQLDEGTDSTYAWASGVDAAGRVTTTWTQNSQTGYTVWSAHLE
jgi:hypothetical protein